MENSDKEKIEQIIRLRKQANVFYLNKSKVYQAFVKLEESTYRNRALSKVQKELIAVGISIVMNCESCLEWHIKQALDQGATENEIIEAIDVGIEMGGGPATVSARFAMNVLEYYNETIRQ
ncbi:MAG: carboxymuconolactone decarboxylase family protein [Tannerellaceae bacterium]|jgi:AhpD family alkylhydroperoxidase|nr:carboxymuconolactone decarboxylase family protein [Tannerellaceae bacterium]